MSPEKQLIAIAEACGWTEIIQTDAYGRCAHQDFNMDWPIYLRGKRDGEFDQIPDYLTDLNACYEMENALDETSITKGMNFTYNNFLLGLSWPYNYHATAAQRAEAFLKTIGKWEDDK
jgi:hypothetical protein